MVGACAPVPGARGRHRDDGTTVLRSLAAQKWIAVAKFRKGEPHCDRPGALRTSAAANEEACRGMRDASVLRAAVAAGGDS